MNEKEQVLSEIKTLARILNTWGNAQVPSIDGKEVTAKERLEYFVNRAMTEFGMTIDDIDVAIA